MALDVWGASNIFVASVHQLIITVLMICIIWKLLQGLFRIGGALGESRARRERIRDDRAPADEDTGRKRKKYQLGDQGPDDNGSAFVRVPSRPVEVREDGSHYVI